MCCCACTSAPGHPPSDGGRQFSWWPGGGLSSVVASAGKPVHRQARGVRQQLPHGHAWLPAMIGRHLPRNKHVVDGGVQVALGDQAQRAHGCDRLADRACLEQCAWRHRVRTAGLWNPRHRPRPTPRRGSRRCRSRGYASALTAAPGPVAARVPRQAPPSRAGGHRRLPGPCPFRTCCASLHKPGSPHGSRSLTECGQNPENWPNNSALLESSEQANRRPAWRSARDHLQR
jgi:hypothetical protein